jgi:hypothetical protein
MKSFLWKKKMKIDHFPEAIYHTTGTIVTLKPGALNAEF